MEAPTLNKPLALFTICFLAAGLLGCTGTTEENRAGDFPMTVTGSVFVPGLLTSTGVEPAVSGSAFLALKVRMENRGSGAAAPAPAGFKAVIDAEGYRRDFSRLTGADPRFDGQDFGTLSIQPKSYAEGWMVFEVPASVKSVPSGELRFSDKALLGSGSYAKAPFSPTSAKRYENLSERFALDVKSMTITYKFTGRDGSVVVPSEGNQFAVCDLSITNLARTKVHLYVTPDNLVFVSSQKTEYVRGTWDAAPDVAAPLKGQDILPLAAARGTVIYEVATDDSYINKVVLRYSAQETCSFIIPKARIDIEANTAPAAKIFANDTGFMDTDIWFDSNGSADAENDAMGRRWDFGDKETASDVSEMARASYKYPRPGAYTVTLTVKDIGGLEGTASKGIKVIHYFSLKQSGKGYENDTQTAFFGKFYVDVNLTNNGNRTRSVPSALFQVKTTEGALYDYAGDDGRDPLSLQAGAWASWRVYFEVPREKVALSITFDGVLTALF